MAIIQGSNIPIRFVFDDINDVPGDDCSLVLRNETKELKHWGRDELLFSEDGFEIEAQITQAESMLWDIGPCLILFKWLSDDGYVMEIRAEDTILSWRDRRELIHAEDPEEVET